MVCNSIVHKLYQSTFIHMKVWNDHITIWNPGTLPDGFTVETLIISRIGYKHKIVIPAKVLEELDKLKLRTDIEKRK